MRLTILRQENCPVTQWAGGQTTQLYIYPEDTQYQQRNFGFRISSAVAVSEELAPFTDLPGIKRQLLILDGVMKVNHVGRYEVELHPYQEIDCFDGGWPTESSGKVRDFNLMLAHDYQGKLTVLSESGLQTVTNAQTHTAFYVGEGDAALILSDGSETTLKQGDMALFCEFAEEESISLRLGAGAKLVRVDVCACAS